MMKALDPDVVEAVRQGLAEGLSWAAIGKRIGRSKNSVSGLVRRHLYGKENGYKNPALKDKPERPPHSRKKKRRAPPPAEPEPVPVMLWVPPPPPPPRYCQWPMSEQRPWRFCEGPAVPGLPYCWEHCRIAFVRWPVAA